MRGLLWLSLLDAHILSPASIPSIIPFVLVWVDSVSFSHEETELLFSLYSLILGATMLLHPGATYNALGSSIQPMSIQS